MVCPIWDDAQRALVNQAFGRAPTWLEPGHVVYSYKEEAPAREDAALAVLAGLTVHVKYWSWR